MKTPTPADAIALYARVSSQIAELRRRATLDGRPVHASYEDNGYSGTTTGSCWGDVYYAHRRASRGR